MTRTLVLLCFAILAVTTSLLPAAPQRLSAPIPWSSTRKLTWDDYQMALPDKRDHDSLTHSEIVYKTNWQCPHRELYFTVIAFFHPEGSWVNPEAKSDDLLRHEQLHFDLAEYYARTLKLKFNRFLVNCALAKSVVKAQTKRIFDENLAELNAESDRYD